MIDQIKAKSDSQTSLQGRRVLVIDDEPEFAESLQDLLELEGSQVEIATNAAMLPDLQSRFDAEVILLDIRLNNTNGIELIDRIRSIWPQARIIIITGYASKETAVEALTKGATNYLEKPIHPDELRTTISRALWIYDADEEVRTSREKLENSLKAAEAANRAKSAFLAHMSHELRTPLNAILALSEIVKDEGYGRMEPSVYLDYVSDIHGAGQHVLSIVNDVLDFAQVELGAKVLDEESVVVEEVIDEACRMVGVAAKDRSVEVTQTSIQPDLRLTADRRMLKQMIVNLLDNAVKFTKPDGRVAIQARQEGDNQTVIEVTDTGIGIDAEKLPEVTEPFSIAEPIYTRGHGGVGLGLSITKQLVERHGGSLELRSKRDVGTTATLRFPQWRSGGTQQRLSNAS